ncbi:MAG: prepilin-type N-terminal cleavage/methylation domain-containing protein, partial [Sulfuricurvum sp.]|nr:prepilin-type N-terminal cleavage/methylation domain-containing protein [Sulfuricurvum sp.]
MQRRGFTLIELSIVLIIIGLIIGGVMKGTDMINSSEQKRFYNTFVKGWQVAVNQYRDRTGQILGDGTANGGNAATTNGVFDNVNLSTTNTVQTRMREIGLDVPITNTSPDGGSYRIEGKYTSQTVVAALQSAGGRNVLRLNNVPTDVALAVDTMIDKTADAGLGNCRRAG